VRSCFGYGALPQAKSAPADVLDPEDLIHPEACGYWSVINTNNRQGSVPVERGVCTAAPMDREGKILDYQDYLIYAD
jgi:hypothetical protein